MRDSRLVPVHVVIYVHKSLCIIILILLFPVGIAFRINNVIYTKRQKHRVENIIYEYLLGRKILTVNHRGHLNCFLSGPLTLIRCVIILLSLFILLSLLRQLLYHHIFRFDNNKGVEEESVKKKK